MTARSREDQASYVAVEAARHIIEQLSGFTSSGDSQERVRSLLELAIYDWLHEYAIFKGAADD